MGTSPRLINIDPAHSLRPSKMVITKRRAELKYKPPDTRYPHPSQASVDHPGPSNTALRHGANLQARTARQSQPSSVVVNSDPTGRHPRNISGLVATQPPPSLPSTQSALLPTRPPALRPLSLALREGGHIDVHPGTECSLPSVCGQHTA